MPKRLYRTPLPDDSLTETGEQLDAELAPIDVLGDRGEVERVSSSAPDLQLGASYRGRYADRLGLELLELLESPISELPLANVEGRGFDDGYYTVSNVRDGGLVAPQSTGATSVQASLSKVGTRNTHLIGVTARLATPEPPHEFGNDTDALVGIAADASNVRVVNSTLKPDVRISPTPVETVTSQHGDVDLYDAADEDYPDVPTFLYDLDYEPQGDVDPGLWDTFGGSYGTMSYGANYGAAPPLDDDGIVDWQRVFDTGHDPRGVLILDNGLLRLYLSDSGGLSVREYDADADEWDAVDLPASDYQLVDADIRAITPPRVEAQLEFADGDTGDLYAVDVALDRGREDVQIWIPESVDDPIPDDLADRLEPIASTSVVDPGVRQSLVSREEVRR